MKEKLNLKWHKRHLSKRMSMLFLANFFVCFSLYAQQRTVTGTVRDVTGETLVGVNIVEKGTTNGTASSIDGTYSLKITGNDAILTANYIGYKSKDI